jgi:hypothetical protein
VFDKTIVPSANKQNSCNQAIPVGKTLTIGRSLIAEKTVQNDGDQSAITEKKKASKDGGCGSPEIVTRDVMSPGTENNVTVAIVTCTRGHTEDTGRAAETRLHTQWVGMEQGMKQLNILPTKCETFLFDMGIFTTSIFMSTEVGKLEKKYQAWHKQTGGSRTRNRAKRGPRRVKKVADPEICNQSTGKSISYADEARVGQEKHNKSRSLLHLTSKG